MYVGTFRLFRNNFENFSGMIMAKSYEDNETPQKYYAIIAIFNVLTMITSNMALQYIPYVVLVVGKGKLSFFLINKIEKC